MKKLHRLGTHTGFWQNACENETPSAANASRFGVCAAAQPRWPMLSARIWSGLTMRMFGFMFSS